MQRDEVGTGNQIVECIHQLHLQASCTSSRQIRIVSKHSHAKTDCTPAQFAADASHADYAERLVVEFDAFEIFLVPSLAANVCVSLWNLTRDAEQQGERMFGSRNRISTGRV